MTVLTKAICLVVVNCALSINASKLFTHDLDTNKLNYTLFKFTDNNNDDVDISKQFCYTRELTSRITDVYMSS